MAYNLTKREYALLFFYSLQADTAAQRARATWRIEAHGQDFEHLSLEEVIEELYLHDFADTSGNLTDAGKDAARDITYAPLPQGEENGL